MSKPIAYPMLFLLAFFLGCVKANFAPIDAERAPTDAIQVDICVDPVTVKPNCQAQPSGRCDPVCQSGDCDWCSQKCTLAGDGTATCAPRGAIASGETCTVFLAGTAQQHDECQPAGICLTPGIGDPISYCFTLCHSEIDCPGAVACSPRPVARTEIGLSASTLVCDPEYTSCDPGSAKSCCDPLALSTVSGGCPGGRFCYLVTPDPSGHSRTTCEYTTGGKGRGEACQSSRDCLGKYVCAPSASGNSGSCQRVCNTASPCSSGTCILLGAEYGYCPL
jgi:hypothetical protein